jgi:protocatechuate 3,4-dioxygenase beta subunit
MKPRKHATQIIKGRRRLLAAGTLGLSGLAMAPAVVAGLLRTPPQSRGPFYPLQLPLDSDNDLVTVANRPALARGVITDLTGQVRNERGRAVAGARVEIWQCDAYGRYHHPWDRRDVPLDENFQGYGGFTTGADGGYRFRTIRPVPYPGRAPHIHFAITTPGAEPLITQMYVAGAKENARDGLLNRIRDPKQRQRLIVDFVPAPGGSGTLLARFDIVLAPGEATG